jgi:hypothetical protein
MRLISYQGVSPVRVEQVGVFTVEILPSTCGAYFMVCVSKFHDNENIPRSTDFSQTTDSREAANRIFDNAIKSLATES